MSQASASSANQSIEEFAEPLPQFLEFLQKTIDGQPENLAVLERNQELAAKLNNVSLDWDQM